MSGSAPTEEEVLIVEREARLSKARSQIAVDSETAAERRELERKSVTDRLIAIVGAVVAVFGLVVSAYLGVSTYFQNKSVEALRFEGDQQKIAITAAAESRTRESGSREYDLKVMERLLNVMGSKNPQKKEKEVVAALLGTILDANLKDQLTKALRSMLDTNNNADDKLLNDSLISSVKATNIREFAGPWTYGIHICGSNAENIETSGRIERELTDITSRAPEKETMARTKYLSLNVVPTGFEIHSLLGDVAQAFKVQSYFRSSLGLDFKVITVTPRHPRQYFIGIWVCRQ